MPEVYCCTMRQRYLIGIIAEDKSIPEPVDVVDFLDFDKKAGDGRPLLTIRFCPFCGKRNIGTTRSP